MTNSPRRIGKFEILDRLGEGAMGEVFLARDTILGREVALKTIHPAALTAPEARERFFREAQASGRLNHPNLVTIHEFGEEKGVLFMAMEYLPGEDLAQMMANRELAPPEILELLAQVCDGLAFAHQRGVLHRDIKPSNVRITRFSGRLAAKVLDFGIARLAESDLTATGTLMGTFGYLAPEYIQAGKPDQRADLFAVGVILYEALAGIRPFGGDSTATVLHRILNEEPPPLDMAPLGAISPGIQEVLARALAKAPANRYPTAEALAADLRAAKDPSWTPGTHREATVRSSSQSFELPKRGSKPPSAPKPSGKAWIYLAVPVILAAAGFAGWRWVRHRRRPAPALVAQITPQITPQATLQAPPPAPVIPPADAPAPAPQESAKPEPPPPVHTEPRSESHALPAGQADPHPSAVPPPKAPKPASTRLANINEAAAALEKDPQGALAFLDQLVKAEPENDRAIALRIVAFYDTGDYRACGRAISEARLSGHPIWPLALKYPRLRVMLEKEKEDPKIPRRKLQAAGPGTSPTP